MNDDGMARDEGRVLGEAPRKDDFGDGTIVFVLGDARWHDGPGWYYYDSEYTDEGSVGAFKSREEAVEDARENGWTGRDSEPGDVR